MKTRTIVLLVMALLVLGAFPASATDSQEDVCDGLLTALDVLENQTRANQRAIDRLQAQAEDAGCLNTISASQQLCESLDGTFELIDDGTILWNCVEWDAPNFADAQASVSALADTCRTNDGGSFLLTFLPEYPGVATSSCVAPPQPL